MLKIIEKIEELVLSFSVIFMAIFLIFSVIMRSVFNNSITFSEEISQFLLITVTFFGLGYCARKAKHISMTIVFDRLNDKNKNKVILIVNFFSALILFILTFLSIQYLITVYNFERVTPALEIPIWLFYLPVSIGFLISGIEYTKGFFKNLKSDKLYISSEVEYSAHDEEV